MRRAGRIPFNARHYSEAVWAVATFCVSLMLVAGLAYKGNTSLVQGHGATSPPIVIPSGSKGAAVQAEIDQLTQRAEAAEARAKQADEEDGQEADSLTRSQESLASKEDALKDAQANLQAADSKLASEESDLKSTKADLAAAVQARKELEAEIASWNSTASGEHDSSASLEAELATTRVKLTEAQAETKKESDQRQEAEAELQKVKEKLAEAKRDLETAQASPHSGSSRGSAPIAPATGNGFFQSCSRPWYMAFLLGVAGAFGVLGPSSYVRVYLPFTGSLVGGLLLAGFFEYAQSSGDVSLLDAMMSILTGSSGWFIEFLWLGLLALGMFRWVQGIDCSLWEVVDDVSLPDHGKKAPLLG